MPPKSAKKAVAKKAAAPRKRAPKKATTVVPEPEPEPEQPEVLAPEDEEEVDEVDEVAEEEQPTESKSQAKQEKPSGQEIIRAVRDELAELIAEQKARVAADRAFLKKIMDVERTLRMHKGARRRPKPHKRTPSEYMDSALVSLLKKGMTKEDFVIKRTSNDVTSMVDLSNLSTKIPVMRTDVTQLLSNYIARNELKGAKTSIDYQKDPAFVNILTTGNIQEKNREFVEQIKEGTYKLTMCLVQKFIGQHLTNAKKAAAAPAKSG
jgi:hypothetical protein